MCSNIGTPNNHHFPFGTNGKVVVLGVPILKHSCFIFLLFLGKLEYQAQSPDEGALVSAARNFGYVFKVSSEDNSLILYILPKTFINQLNLPT